MGLTIISGKELSLEKYVAFFNIEALSQFNGKAVCSTNDTELDIHI